MSCSGVLSSLAGPADFVFSWSADLIDGLSLFSLVNLGGLAFAADRYATASAALSVAVFSTMQTVAAPASLPVGGAPRTMSAWAKCPAGGAGLRVIASYGANSPNQLFSLCVSGDSLYFMGYCTTPAGRRMDNTRGALRVGGCIHFRCVLVNPHYISFSPSL